MVIHLLRHAHAAKALVDADRVLSDKGREHAQRRATAFEDKFIKKALVTNVPRGHQTAEAMLAGITGGSFVTIVGVNNLYPVGKFPAMDAAFEKLGYSPLRAYLVDEQVAAELSEYAARAWEAMMAELAGENGNFLAIGHAVCSPAIAHHVGRLLEADQRVLDQILDANLGELEGFEIDYDAGTIALITEG